MLLWPSPFCQEKPYYVGEALIMKQLSLDITKAVTEGSRKDAPYRPPVAHTQPVSPKPAAPVDTNDGYSGKISSLEYKVGNTLLLGRRFYSILPGYDRKTNEFILWIPKNYYGSVSYIRKQIIRVNGYSFRTEFKKSPRPFVACSVCGGAGSTYQTHVNSYTRDLPQGYFSGIEATVTKSRTITERRNCTACNEDGVVLPPAR